MLKWAWIIWVTLCCLGYCQSGYGNDWSLEETVGTHQKIHKGDPKVRTVTKHEYVVVEGDTLGGIATKFGTTWEELWKLNLWIKDPDIIHIGSKIRIEGRIADKPIPKLTEAQKIEKLAKFMFRKSGIPHKDEESLAYSLQDTRYNISYSNVFDFDEQRAIISRYHTITRQYEIWLLAKAIVELVPDDTEFYCMVGLAWQETQFINRPGKHGEVGFYQFLPSTIKSHFKLDDVGLVSALYNLRNDPRIATATALEMLRDYKWNWSLWNHGHEYEYYLNNKIRAVRLEFNRR